ncbi:MAG: redoxin domain-containing protein [Armatimonadetes bacterium]|nr:redoxin domain-containing protein [Armatimonadota bacterium]
MRPRALLIALMALAAACAAQLPLGSPTPDFALYDLSGTLHRLSNHKGKAKAVVLLWFGSDCPVCHAYEQRVQALRNEFADKGVVLYAINSNAGESADAIRAHQRAASLTFTVLKDHHNKVADTYHAVATPEAFVLDTDLRLRYWGAIDNASRPERVDPAKRYLRNAIAAVLANRRPSPDRVQGEGCAIERE